MIASVYTHTALLFGIALVTSIAEHLYNRNQMRPGGVFHWSIVGVDRDPQGTGLWRRSVGLVMGSRVFTVILVVQGIAGVGMMVLAWQGTLSVLVQGTILGVQLLVLYRNRYALEGADQMMLILAAALFGHALMPESSVVATAALWFVALQSILSYCTSGVSKLFAPTWRSGEALQAVMNTETYGTQAVAKLMRDRPRLAAFLCWNVIVIQSLFPLSLVLGAPYGAVFLLWGAAFHFANVLIMEIHRFFWAFLATYPAIWFCMTQRWVG